MSCKGTDDRTKEKAGATNRVGSPCECMTAAETHAGCGSQMQEIMSRCMSSFGEGQKEPLQSGTDTGGHDEDK